MEKRPMPALFPPPTRFLPQISRHVERTIGHSPMVFHEVVSCDVHLDLHVVPPQPDKISPAFPHGRRFYTIVTSGLSTRPMKLPASSHALEQSAYAELMITLPADWPGFLPDGTMSPNLMSEDENSWPLRWIKRLAHLAHEQDVFLGAGNPYAAESHAVAGNCRLAGMLAAPSALHPKSATLPIRDDLTIAFLALWPVFPEELAFAQRHGGPALLQRLHQAGVTDLVDIHRKNVAPALSHHH
jgi:hypothetical protein